MQEQITKFPKNSEIRELMVHTPASNRDQTVAKNVIEGRVL